MSNKSNLWKNTVKQSFKTLPCANNLFLISDLSVYLSVPTKTNYSQNKADFYLKATRFYEGW